MSEAQTEAKAPAQVVSEFGVTVEQVQDYEFRVEFGKPNYSELTMDEPPPLGKDAGPSPSRLLAAAIGDCLGSSLLFCARKARLEIGPIRVAVKTQIARNERGRLRVSKVSVEIDPNIPEADRERAVRCLELFEDFCTVTQSIRQGIDVGVSVKGFSR